VHIKDSRFIEESGGIFPKSTFTYPGEGDGDVEAVVRDLLASGYDGGFSMEPHLQVVFHEEDGGTAEEARYESYVTYGKRFMELVARIRASL
jgi:sugar phosphate isomerase/epimerase